MSWEPGDEDNPIDDRLRELLVGKVITSVDRIDGATGKVTLDDGTVLTLYGNEGCGGCDQGWYDLTELNIADGIITNVRTNVVTTDDYGSNTYQVFVVTANTETMVASFDGHDNGYYGEGWWLQVEAP